MEKRRVVVFGIFDGLHEGHRYFLREAKKKGGELVVVVGRDSSVKLLKHKTPAHSQEERMTALAKEPLVDKAILGDEELSSYEVLEALKPDVICFGFDQQELREDIEKWLKQRKQPIAIYSCQKLDR